MRNRIRVFQSSLAALVRLEDRLAPAVFTVLNIADSGPDSLRDCVSKANATLGTDTINFSALFNSAQTITLTTGELAISEAVTITGPGSSLLTVSGNLASRHFNTASAPAGSAINLSGMKLTAGKSALDGGAIFAADENLTLTNCVVSGNTAVNGDGGGIYLQLAAGSLNLVGCSLNNNVAVGTGKEGGAINIQEASALTIRDTNISGNTADARGGAIYFKIGGSLLLVNSTLSGNTASKGIGGGVYFIGAATPAGLTVLNSTISGNTSALSGGGIVLRYFNDTLVVRNSTITSNQATAGTGGGISHLSGTGTIAIESSIISGNTNGAAPDLYSASVVTAKNCAIGSNTGFTLTDQGGNLPFGAALQLAPLANNGGPTPTHMLLAGSPCLNVGSNPAALSNDQRGTGFARNFNGVDIGAFESQPAGIPTVSGTFADVTLVDMGKTSRTITVTYADDVAVKVATIDNNDLTVTGPNGFSTPAGGVVLVSTSPTTDAKSIVATYSFTPPGGSWTSDDSGKYSVLMNANQVSDGTLFVPAATIGTFYAKLTSPQAFIVVNANDSGAGSFRAAVAAANSNIFSTDTVTFDPTVFATAQKISLTTGKIVIDDSVVITGPAVAPTLDAGSLSQILNINGAGQITVAISNLNFSAAKTTGTTFDDNGAAIHIDDEIVSLTNCKLTNNNSSADGGAIWMQGSAGALTIDGCTLSNNNAKASGGAVGSAAGGVTTILNSTFTGNKATNGGAGGDGGAIARLLGGTLNVNNTTISNNSSDSSGGGIYTQGGKLNLTNSTLNGNVAAQGGGVATQTLPGAQDDIENSTISGNMTTDPANGRGGGVAMFGFESGVGYTKFTMRNSTVTNNKSVGATGGGVHLSGASTNPVVIESSIISGNVHPFNAGPSFKLSPDFYGPYAPASTAPNVTINKSLIGVQNTYVAPTAGTGNLFGTVATPLDAKLAPLAQNGAPANRPMTHALLAGSPAINAGSNSASLAYDERGPGFVRTAGIATDIGAFEVQPPPRVQVVTVNDGSVQRSRVTSLKVTFDQHVTLPVTPATAFTLTKQVMSETVSLSAAVDDTGSGTAVTLTFTGGAVEFGSLKDGRYTLTALATQVSNANGSLDGNGDGTGGDNYVLASAATPNPPTNIFRLFGDSNGDGTVAANDFIQFRLALGGNSPIFDFDGDGAVAASDFIQFRLRFGGSI